MPDERENLSEENINNNINESEGRILRLPLVGEIKTSYLNYAMSVIVGRALPDARDGLKPVQRRVLYAMSELGLKHNTAYKKSARIVGETMGKYHPHGDSAIYDTMVRLAQNWNLRYPLVDGQGNFGSIDGDSPAAMRYTEARLSWLGELMLSNIDEDTIDWGQNFDESLKEPLTLPCIMPNLLVNGSTGIAVGMATNIPPHNLREVVDVLCWLIENEIEPEQADLKDIMKLLPGPDFPTGGEIAGRSGILEAYSTGRGKIIVRGKTHVEENKRGRQSIVVTEIPYAVNKTLLLENMVQAVQDKDIEGISEIRDESDRDGLRIVLELQRDADSEFITRQLYKRTQLQTTFGVINLALVDKHPVILNINQMLGLYLNYRRDVVRRRTEYRLKQAQAREHIIEGLKKALENIEAVIKIIRANNSAPEAKAALTMELEFSDGQAQAILDMRLQRLTGLERNRLDEEQKKLLADIAAYKNILADKKVLDGVIRDELKDLAARFGDKRRTELVAEFEEMPDEAFIQEEDIVITLSKDGLIKRLPLDLYKSQARGGKGRKGSGVYEDDSIELLCVTHTHREIFFFTNLGRMMSVKGYEITETKSGKGKPVAKFLPLLENEKIVNIAGENSKDWKFAFFITRMGIAKRVAMEELESSKRPRKIMTLDIGDEIAQVCLTSGKSDLLLISKDAQALRVSEEEFRSMGRTARGVRAMKLKDDDRVLSCDVVDDSKKIFVLSEKGIGKRSDFSDFTPHHRATGGVFIMDLSKKTGRLSASIAINDNDEIIAITSKGRTIRVPAFEISLLRRQAQGNKVLRLDDGDTVADCSVVRGSDDEDATVGIPFEEAEEAKEAEDTEEKN
ncbi:MAG: DNA gyrase subunit A [Synergistales bacterium]|nr:DNA gyrase subunit A [Synergistales bacterium]MDY6402163.1 DNA gyrase subunit A [Synergistales bacterium]MDY6404494.1 DNA gyrase subunit A [Synergistales bacterium]MDY6410566.1 DNA gyrase subunit A [Synergistales bacterium]MDY6413681.1 DNA gyrase subunit A [Synergistales bacterium]